MHKGPRERYGALGETKTLHFDPAKLVVVEDEKHALYDERSQLPISAELVASILHHGRVLQPVIVRKNPETGDLEVVAGRQRVRAVLEINKRGEVFKSLAEHLQKRRGKENWKVPALIDRAKDDDLAEVMVSENEIRENDSPLVRAEKMRRLLGRGKTEEELSVLFGCSSTTVKNTLNLLEASSAVKKAVDSGRIAVSAAYKLAKMPAAEQKEKVAALLAESPATGVRKRPKAKRVREIVEGTAGPRAPKEIQALLEEVSTTDHIKENARLVAVAVLEWVLGGETLGQFYDREEKTEEKGTGTDI